LLTARNATKVEVRLDGKVVQDPYLVTVIIRNVGPSDISEANFNRANPLKLTVDGAKVVDFMDSSEEDLPYTLGGEGDTVLVGPGLLPAKSELSLRILTEGEPEAIDIGDLINVDVKGMPRPLLSDPWSMYMSEPLARLMAEQVQSTRAALIAAGIMVTTTAGVFIALQLLR
jgi:hypothetical protein